MNGAVQQQDRIIDFKYLKTKSSIFKLLLSFPLPVGVRQAILDTTRLEMVRSFKRHSPLDLLCRFDVVVVELMLSVLRCHLTY